MKKITFLCLMISLLMATSGWAVTYTFSDKDFLGGASWGEMDVTATNNTTLNILYTASSSPPIPAGSQATGFGFGFDGSDAITISNTGYDSNPLDWVILTNLNALPNPSNGDQFDPIVTKFMFTFGATEGDPGNITPPGILPGQSDMFDVIFSSSQGFIGMTDEQLANFLFPVGVRLQSLPDDINEGSLLLVGNVVPEPGTMILLGSGLIGLAGWGRKKFRK